ncbi:RNA-binding protein 12 [Portunus trituberculatus]|uniref:RNA-binding protein 12 n=1 Tax=Portunus trituberculatus TaxID=210409 RepID=A0A5B7IJV7_PORTR|nr:RNA-binding protein 12 [Portunus trituberculatus]
MVVGGLSCPALPCPALPCPALACPALPCPALPCPALPCPILLCPALHCLPFINRRQRKSLKGLGGLELEEGGKLRWRCWWCLVSLMKLCGCSFFTTFSSGTNFLTGRNEGLGGARSGCLTMTSEAPCSYRQQTR